MTCGRDGAEEGWVHSPEAVIVWSGHRRRRRVPPVPCSWYVIGDDADQPGQRDPLVLLPDALDPGRFAATAAVGVDDQAIEPSMEVGVVAELDNVEEDASGGCVQVDSDEVI